LVQGIGKQSMDEKERQKKLEHLASQVPASEDPEACEKCREGKHMDCWGGRLCICEWCS